MVQVVAALIWDHERFLICQRPAHKARGLLWEFVGGKVECNEENAEALCRECEEELGIKIKVRNKYFEVDHEYPDISIHLTLFNAEIESGTLQLLEHNDFCWIHPNQISDFEFCPADEEILNKIQDDYARLCALRGTLTAASDLKYKSFQCSLMPTVSSDRVLGVRMPALRKIFKELSKDPEWFLTSMPLQYYEYANLYGLLISRCDDFDCCVRLLNSFLPHVDNWATCDLIVPAIFAKNKESACQIALSWLKENHTYTVRFAIGVLMRFGLDSPFRQQYADLVAAISTDEYYVKMMIAWYFATAMAVNFDFYVSYLKRRILPKWIHNKAIQKGIESHRLTDDQKIYLRSLRK